MTDHIDFGTTPTDEQCAQVGADDYYQRARKEAKAFINQLKRTFGDPPPGATYVIARNPHDFGSYLTVRLEFDNTDAAVDYALKVENEEPEHWDALARQELSTPPRSRMAALRTGTPVRSASWEGYE